MTQLDIRTLSLMTSFISAIVGLVLLVFYRTRKTYSGFHLWVWSAGMILGGLLLIGFRGHLSDLLSIVLANLLVALGFAMMMKGVYSFYEKHLSPLLWITPVILAGIILCYFTFWKPSVSARIVTMSPVLAFYSLLAARIAYQTERLKETDSQAALVYIPLIILGLYYLSQILYTLLYEHGIEDYLQASTFHAISFFIGTGCNIAMSAGFILINSQRLEQELRDAYSKVRTLEGIVPICMHCKQIRDDQGYWNRLETFISSHTEARFSHSICDSCLTERYPELQDKE